MIAGGFSDGQIQESVHVIDLLGGEIPCTVDEPMPMPLTQTAGAFVNGAPIIVGGISNDGPQTVGYR